VALRHIIFVYLHVLFSHTASRYEETAFATAVILHESVYDACGVVVVVTLH